MDTNSLKFESLLNTWSLQDQDVALVTQEGLILLSHAQHVTDFCSLPTSVQVAQQYLKLKENELAICNDPYTGGSIPSQITLITAFRLRGTESQLLLLGTRISTRPKLSFGKSVDDDGLKIPPTPLGTLDEPTQAILSAISSHPLSPDDFEDKIQKGLIYLREAKASLLAALEAFDLDLTRSVCQTFVQDSHVGIQNLLGEFPHGHSEVQWVFESGEKLRLHLENTGLRLNLEFKGTGNLFDFHLTEAHVLGCAVRVLEQMAGHRIPVNSGSLLAFNLIVPQHSLVSSQAPHSTTLGVLVGSHIVCDLIARCMCLLHPKKRKLFSTSIPIALSFQFKTRSFFDLLQSGSLATAERRGEVSIDVWNDSKLSPSVEDIEARFPIELLALKKRTDSGGNGDHKGGDGILKVYHLQEPAKLRWFGGFPIKMETNSNSGLGLPPEVIIKIGEEETTFSNLKGEIDLPSGATVSVLSRGGHGYYT